MTCNIIYSEMMSLKLDGLLDGAEREDLDRHVAACSECALTWTTLQRADSLLCASVAEPLPVPVDLHARVMYRVAATPVWRPQTVPRLAPATAPLVVVPEMSIWSDWQQRLGAYARGIAGVALSLFGTVALLLTLLTSGSISLGGPFASVAEVLRTFSGAAGMWVRSVVMAVGPEAWASAGVVLALLVLVGWQMVTSYQRAALIPYEQAA